MCYSWSIVSDLPSPLHTLFAIHTHADNPIEPLPLLLCLCLGCRRRRRIISARRPIERTRLAILKAQTQLSVQNAHRDAVRAQHTPKFQNSPQLSSEVKLAYCAVTLSVCMCVYVTGIRTHASTIFNQLCISIYLSILSFSLSLYSRSHFLFSLA